MSRSTRLLWLCVAAAILIVAVVIFKPGGGSDDSPGSPTRAASTTPAATGSPGEPLSAEATPTPTPTPRPLIVQVRGLQPVGGIKQLAVKKGGRIRFTITSDRPEEIHTHGYDISREVAPDRPARFDFPATIEGIFEVELEHAGVQVLKLKVEP